MSREKAIKYSGWLNSCNAWPVIAAFTSLFFAVLFFKQVIYTKAFYDDSFITFRYVVNLLHGRGFVFNPGDQVNSASSLFYSLLLAAFGFLGIDITTAALVLGLASLFILVFLTVKFLSEFTTPTIATLLCVPFILSGSLLGWATSGMETVIFSLLLIAFFYFYFKKNLLLAYCFLSCLTLSRPEGVIVPLTFVVATAYSFSCGRVNHGKKQMRVAVFGLSVFLFYIAFNRLYYGDYFPWPATFKLVTKYYSPGHMERLSRSGIFLICSFPLYVFSVFFLIVERTELRVRAGFSNTLNELRFLLLTVSFAAFASFALGPVSDLERYVVPFIPLFVISAGICWSQLNMYKHLVVKSFGLLMILAQLGLASLDLQKSRTFFEQTVSHQIARQETGEWISDNIPTDKVILSSDLGALSYFAPKHKFFDVFGLVTKEPVLRLGSGTCLLDYLATQNFNFIIADTKYRGSSQTEKILQNPGDFYHIGSQTRCKFRLQPLKTLKSITVDDFYSINVLEAVLVPITG